MYFNLDIDAVFVKLVAPIEFAIKLYIFVAPSALGTAIQNNQL